MNIGKLMGIILSVKSMNGKIKIKFSSSRAIFAYVFLMLLFVIAMFLLVLGIIGFNFEYIFYSIIGMFCFSYLFLISPYTQNSNNYRIEFKNDNSLENFELFYKGKLVNIKYLIDNEGKIKFKNNNNKLSCVSYDDNSKMSNIIKYRIINYFGKWLSENDLLSSDVTTTFEKL